MENFIDAMVYCQAKDLAEDRKESKNYLFNSAISTQKLRSFKNRLLPLNEKIKHTVNLK
ncbi:hypothetical protein KMZ14_03070 [Acinetobacter schindleri]|uniref:hypothetical protein n=1 Tax=Acinetobacter schindleri TaxID=108981 RepID=UPI002362E82F|nr:hypothetical protein [Acinetobacter schindleri]WDE16556.1 hypothetical protein KMZ14_03070 [Acinetobacter schindleri]